jgi:hypothetical protein
MTMRFNEAFREYLGVLEQFSTELAGCGEVVVIRDLLGRLRLALSAARPKDEGKLNAALRAAAGPFFGNAILIGPEMVSPDGIFRSVDLRRVGSVWVLERTLIGADWGRPPLQNNAPRPPRATLYGIKGGVGRSTALCAWARHLAAQEQRVLVVDLDLESPGVSSALLPPGTAPELGIVDWLVEDAVDKANDVVSLMAAHSPLEQGTAGAVLVVPCSGATNQGADYMAKLARAYLDVPRKGGTPRSFGERLAAMLDNLESEYQPTIVLLDSRAGLHDIAGIATTRLGATTFLFGIDSRQTWDGYRIVLGNWAARPAIARDVRERLHIVAAQVPETGREVYLERATLAAYGVFSETLYEEAGPARPNAYNFDISAAEAPHQPIPIYWSRPFQDWDPLSAAVTEDQIRGAFGEFLREATELVLSSETE